MIMNPQTQQYIEHLDAQIATFKQLIHDVKAAAKAAAKIEKAPKAAKAQAVKTPKVEPKAVKAPKATKFSGSKSDFIRANPTLSVSEVVAAAAAQGIEMSKGLVYAARKGQPKAEKTAKAVEPKAAKAEKTAKAVEPKAAGSKGAKSAFIHANPTLSVAEVVAAAAAAGIKISTGLVYAARKGQPKAAKAEKAPPKAQKTATKFSGSKSDFIRANPTLSVSEVVAAAAAQGIEMSKALVYAARKGQPKAEKAPKAEKTAKAGKAPKAEKAAKAQSEKTAPASPDAHGGKTAFIRSLPADMPVAEVVARAAAQGIEMSKALVYAARKGQPKAAKAEKAPKAPKAEPKAAKAPTSPKAEVPEESDAEESDVDVLGPELLELEQKMVDEVDRGERPPFHVAVALVLGTESKTLNEVMAGLAERGWTPPNNDPRGYATYALTNAGIFQRDFSKGTLPIHYRVREGIGLGWEPAPKYTDKFKGTLVDPNFRVAKAKTNGKVSKDVESTLDDLGSVVNPFD